MWKARCLPLADRTISGWLRTKTLLSSPKAIFKIRNTHTCFCRLRLPEQAALGAGLTPINIISPAAGITPRHQGNFCGALLRTWKIPRMAARLMRARLIGVRILRPGVLRTYRQDWQPRSGLDTDDIVRITISALRAIPVKPSLRMSRAGHGSSNPYAKPVIKQFVKSPNCSCRNGASIDKIVLHCTEGSLASALAEFQKSDGRQVSAHYVIDRNGDIYQMVSDSDRSNHCMGANQNSIGIEHVGSETDSLAAPQAAASAALIRWLLEQYHIPRTNIFGHDFAPGYCGPGGTSCPDKLFGAVHSKRLSLPGWKPTCEHQPIKALW